MNTTRHPEPDDEPREPAFAFEDPNLAHGFTAAPNWLFARSELSTGARLTYIALLHYAWKDPTCFPGQLALAEAVGCTINSITRHTQELVQYGLITVKRRGLGKTNLYTFLNTLNPDSPLRGNRTHVIRESGPDPQSAGNQIHKNWGAGLPRTVRNEDTVDEDTVNEEYVAADVRAPARAGGSVVELDIDPLTAQVCEVLRVSEDPASVQAVALSTRKWSRVVTPDDLLLELAGWNANRGERYATPGRRVTSWHEWIARAARTTQRLAEESQAPPRQYSPRERAGKQPPQYQRSQDESVADAKRLLERIQKRSGTQ